MDEPGGTVSGGLEPAGIRSGYSLGRGSQDSYATSVAGRANLDLLFRKVLLESQPPASSETCMNMCHTW
jgi:hypothetical protein